MLLHKTIHLEIYYHKQEQFIETCWKNPALSLDYQNCLNAYVQVIQQYKVKCWLDDQRQAGLVRATDQQWAIREWTSNFIPFAGKLKKIAQVNSPDVFNYGLSTILQHIIYLGKTPFCFREFDNHPDAKNWLLS